MSELLIGCGASREKRLGRSPEWSKLTTVDINADHRPDVVWDLRDIPWPFEGDRFDEVHAYEVLEHLGQQGDYRAFFDQFSEIWRVLKPDGWLCATVPAPGSVWVWGDPSHTRVIQPESLVFLSQEQYRIQVDTPETRTPMSDFRFCYSADFEVEDGQIGEDTFAFILRAVKT